MSNGKGEIGTEGAPQSTYAGGLAASSPKWLQTSHAHWRFLKGGKPSPMKVYLQPQSKQQLGNLASLPLRSRAATSKPRQQVSNCNVASKYLSESLAVACPIYSPHLSSNSITAQSKNVSQNSQTGKASPCGHPCSRHPKILSQPASSPSRLRSLYQHSCSMLQAGQPVTFGAQTTEVMLGSFWTSHCYTSLSPFALPLLPSRASLERELGPLKRGTPHLL